MPLRQKAVAIVISITIFFAILELVRRRELREEYSWLWLLTGACLLVLTFWYDLLVRLTLLVGAVTPTSALFFFSIVFLMLVCLQFSVRISRLTNQVKNLSQELALLRIKLDEDKDGG